MVAAVSGDHRHVALVRRAVRLAPHHRGEHEGLALGREARRLVGQGSSDHCGGVAFPCIASHIRAGVHGMSMWRMPYGLSERGRGPLHFDRFGAVGLHHPLAAAVAVEGAQLSEERAAVEDGGSENLAVGRDHQRRFGGAVPVDEGPEHRRCDEGHVREHQHRARRVFGDRGDPGAHRRVHAASELGIHDRRAAQPRELCERAVALVAKDDQHRVQPGVVRRGHRAAQHARAA